MMCVKDAVRKMVCDKAVCERWYVTKLCVKDCVCVTKWCVKDGVSKMVCERWSVTVCERWCVKDVVSKMVYERWCVKDGVSKRVCERWCEKWSCDGL